MKGKNNFLTQKKIVKGVLWELSESWIYKSNKQEQLESNGCVFIGQELLDNHELDINKECYCGRPNRKVV